MAVHSAKLFNTSLLEFREEAGISVSFIISVKTKAEVKLMYTDTRGYDLL